MSDADRSDPLRSALLRVLDSLPEVAIVAHDRYLTIIGSTARARLLHPYFRPGVNISRFVFLDDPPDTGVERAPWYEATASALRSSIARHSEDSHFLDLLGELAAGSDAFTETWAQESRDTPASVVSFDHPSLGAVRLLQTALPLGGSSSDTLIIWTGADD
ncbi:MULTISPECIES: hypothetical protein [unclassified Microbacterium]|uniref:MmyB family transcriptional regulator n=1 Tax=unclassified Microbacterium TaxID=2609290 RepID=UPI003744C1B3